MVFRSANIGIDWGDDRAVIAPSTATVADESDQSRNLFGNAACLRVVLRKCVVNATFRSLGLV